MMKWISRYAKVYAELGSPTAEKWLKTNVPPQLRPQVKQTGKAYAKTQYKDTNGE